MKKSELVIGKEYYVAPATDWQEGTWGTERVRIVDLDHGKWKWSTDKYIRSDRSSARTGLVVERLDEYTGKVTGQVVVTLASIRGEWEPTKKLVEDRRAGIDAAVAANKQKQLLAQLATGKAVALAQQLGVPGVKADVYGRKIEIDPEILTALLNALDTSGWKFGKVTAA